MNLLLNLKTVARRATILCLLSFLFTGPSIAAVLQVGPSPEANFNSIQAAIDASFAGDTIRVSPGIYAENIAVGKSLIIESTGGAGATTIQSPDSGTAITITAAGVTLDGFKISGANTAISMLGGGSSVVKNNHIGNDNIVNLSYGIQVFQASNNNRFENNQISNSHFGMFLTHNSNNNEIIGGQIQNCQFGIYMSVLTGATVSGVNFLQNNWYGLYLESAMSVQVSDNEFVGNDVGVSAGRSNGNRIFHNNFIDNPTHVRVPADLVLAKSYTEGGNYWSGLAGTDLNVDGILDDPYVTGEAIDPFPVVTPSGWNSISPLSFVTNQTTGERYSGIQAAVDTAFAGDVLVVDANDPTAASGLKSYYENVHVSESVTIRGQGAELTTLYALDRAGKIFTVTSNDAAIQDMALLNGAMGVHLISASNAMLSGLYISSNRSQSYGILVGSKSLNALLQDNHVDNLHFGMFITQLSDGAKVQGGSVVGNRFGIYAVAYAGGEISDVDFLENQWNGLYIETARDLLITRNDFIDNAMGLVAGGGGHRIFHNNFINNQTQASGGFNSSWDDGYPNGGNHWSDWVAPDLLGGEFQDQVGSDGFVDLAYELPPYIADRYPFVRVSGWAITESKLFAQLRQEIEALTPASIPAPTENAADGWRGSLLGKLAEAESFYASGHIAEALEKLDALAKKCDGLHKGGPDMIIDDPSTAVDERESIFNLIQSLKSLLIG
ncbi:MAG: right-handed parallel beta-helix repeat-containing protein [Gammaproteobacteria bacterium]|nr:right-handed parallel beta-helix repeat-containing protein [Gammaproteobacteria bacterium]